MADMKTIQIKKARAIEKRITDDKMVEYKQDLKVWQDDPKNRIDNPDGAQGAMNKGPRKPTSFVGRYESSLNYIKKYNSMSKEEKDKIAKEEKKYRMDKTQFQQAKEYIGFIAKQTSHKNLDKKSRPLMQDAKVGE
tara:strand:+ start:4654 stop:5061 length:408 start_codon:yes stop_codon:yes gene_type:complete